MSLEWILFYEDGKVIESTNCLPEDAPHGVVQIILSKSERGWVMLQGHDYYAYVQYQDGWGEWFELPTVFDMHNRVLYKVEPIKRIFKGLSERDSNWLATFRRAKTKLKKLKEVK